MENWKHKILLAGKYLNVIRECGIEIKGDAQVADERDWDMDGEKSVPLPFFLERS
jgi:gamma-tubulin complex component 2